MTKLSKIYPGAILIDTHVLPSIRLSTHLVTLVARPCLQIVLMELHSTETPLCRPKVKSDLEDSVWVGLVHVQHRIDKISCSRVIDHMFAGVGHK